MIINFHPKLVMSTKGKEIIERIKTNNNHEVVHVSDKNLVEWKEIVEGDQELILISPVFWWGVSYLFDKWIQEVFAYGFAYRHDENGNRIGLLNGRKFEIHLTHDTKKENAVEMKKNIEERLQKGIFKVCGASAHIKFYDLDE